MCRQRPRPALPSRRPISAPVGRRRAAHHVCREVSLAEYAGSELPDLALIANAFMLMWRRPVSKGYMRSPSYSSISSSCDTLPTLAPSTPCSPTLRSVPERSLSMASLISIDEQPSTDNSDEPCAASSSSSLLIHSISQLFSSLTPSSSSD